MIHEISIDHYRASVLLVIYEPQKRLLSKLKHWGYEGNLADVTVPEQAAAVTIPCNGGSSMVVVRETPPQPRLTTIIVHEMIHAAEHILKSCGIRPKGEPLAYLVEYLVHEALVALRKRK